MRNITFLVLAVLSGVMTWVLLTQNQPSVVVVEPLADEDRIVEVLVVNQALNRGTVINNRVLAWQPTIAKVVPADAIVRSAPNVSLDDLDVKITGRVLRSNVYEGELLRTSFLVSGSASFMALAVAPGMRAIAIRITRDELAGGYILPEDKVDVIQTVRQQDDEGTFGVSEVILRNIRVLAVGEQATQFTVFQSAEQQQALENRQQQLMALGETITLELDEDQAKVLLSALQTGSFTLALRAIEDHGVAEVGENFVRSGGGQNITTTGSGAHLISLIEGGVERTITFVGESQTQGVLNEQ